MSIILTFLKAHWRPFAVLAALAIAFASGRYSRAAKVVTIQHETTHEVVREVVKQDIAAQEQIKQLTAQLDTIKHHTRREETTVTKPDGTKETHLVLTTSTDTTSDKHAETDDTKALHAVSLSDRTVDKTHDVFKEKIVTSQPRWFVGALVLFTPGPGALKDPLGALSAGLEANYRVLGPVSVGLSATVPVSRPITWPTLGISLGVNF